MVHHYVNAFDTAPRTVSDGSHNKGRGNVKGGISMAARTNSKRACIMIVDQDFDYGIRLADWLASQRYQVVLVRSLQTAIPEFLDVRPGAVLVGLAQTESAFPLDLQGLFRVIETTGPHVPVIIMGNRTSGVLTNIVYSGSLRHLHLPIKPVELTYLGRLLQSELNAATASRHVPRREPGPFTGRAVKNDMHERTVSPEVNAWIR
jgi:DNA-binding NtrC family response regulator